MSKTLQGKFRPQNPDKYKGDAGNILYRSSWELEFMKWCDRREQIIWWQSEEKAIWYYCPIMKKNRRYFPDFILARQTEHGIMEEVIEIKPQKQIDGPKTNPKRKTKYWLNEVYTYANNTAKWKAAMEWAEDRGMNFRLLSEQSIKEWQR